MNTYKLFEANRDSFTENMLAMKERLEKQVEILERKNKTLPMQEFFRPNLLHLLSHTTDPKTFAHILLSVGTLSAVPPLVPGNEEDYLEKIYTNYVFKKGDCWQLILAWSQSENHHMLGKLEEWLKQAEETQSHEEIAVGIRTYRRESSSRSPANSLARQPTGGAHTLTTTAPADRQEHERNDNNGQQRTSTTAVTVPYQAHHPLNTIQNPGAAASSNLDPGRPRDEQEEPPLLLTDDNDNPEPRPSTDDTLDSATDEPAEFIPTTTATTQESSSVDLETRTDGTTAASSARNGLIFEVDGKKITEMKDLLSELKRELKGKQPVYGYKLNNIHLDEKYLPFFGPAVFRSIMSKFNVGVVDAPQLSQVEVSFSKSPRNYKKALKAVLPFSLPPGSSGRSKLNSLGRLSKAILKVQHWVLIHLDKPSRTLIISHFSFFNPNEYLRDLAEQSPQIHLHKFSCCQQTIELQALAMHHSELKQLNLNLCRFKSDNSDVYLNSIEELIGNFKCLDQLRIDSARMDNKGYELDLDLICRQETLTKIVLGHSTVMSKGIKAEGWKKLLDGKTSIVFFNCDLPSELKTLVNGTTIRSIERPRANLRKALLDASKFSKEDRTEYCELFQLQDFFERPQDWIIRPSSTY